MIAAAVAHAGVLIIVAAQLGAAWGAIRHAMPRRHTLCLTMAGISLRLTANFGPGLATIEFDEPPRRETEALR